VGQKVHPYGFRLGYIKTWKSRWYAEKDYSKQLHEDLKIKKLVKKKLYHAGVSRIEIERSGNQLRVSIYSSRPGIIIGRKGTEIDKLKVELGAVTSNQVYININEIKKPELDAQLVSENIAMQLERRVAYRRAMKKVDRIYNAFGRTGYESVLFREGWEVLRLRERSGIAREECPFIRFELILIMAWQKQ